MISNPTKIKIEMLKKGITGADIARRAGVTRVAIYHVIEGRVKSTRLRKAIADALGMKIKQIWPENNKRKAA
jgi:lambda repressor-like predicted transcriptional regulator